MLIVRQSGSRRLRFVCSSPALISAGAAGFGFPNDSPVVPVLSAQWKHTLGRPSCSISLRPSVFSCCRKQKTVGARSNPPPSRKSENNTPNYRTKAGSHTTDRPDKLKVVPRIRETDRCSCKHLIIASHFPHQHSDGKENNSKRHQSIEGRLAPVSNVSRNPHSPGPLAANHLGGNFLV